MRRGYLDWLRGLAVLIMIEAHTIDSWTRPDYRQTVVFGRAIVLGGFGAPLFLFLAGVAVALSAGSKYRAERARPLRSQNEAAHECERKRAEKASPASAAVRRRGWQIFGLAFLFRLQSYLLNPGSSPEGLLKVDILNIMGPAIVAAAAVWGLFKTQVTRLGGFMAVTIALALATPIVRATTLLDPLPDPVEWYLRPYPGRTNFTLFPWAGFVFGGAAVGVLLDAARDPGRERRVNVGLAVAGTLIALAGYLTSLLPSIYERSTFWTSSPTFFFLRLGLLTAAVPAAYLWERTPTAFRWSPMQQLGRTSLFIYWIHVEMVYGVLSRPLHRHLTVRQVLVAYILFTILMLGLSLVKTWIVSNWPRWGPALRERVLARSVDIPR